MQFHVDIGNPQLSMHSIRETGGTDDVAHGINLLRVSKKQIF
jgi:aspartyl aminopeptidase